MKRLTDKQVKALAAKLDAEAKHCTEYVESEDGAEAEYCQSFGYGDGELELDDLDDEVRDNVLRLKSLLSKRSFRNVMEKLCSLELGDMYRVDNSIFSFEIGEVEHQIDDLGLRELSPEDRERVRRQMVEAYLGDSDCIYTGHNGQFWRMILDPEKLAEKLEQVKRSRPSKKRSRRRSAMQLREQVRTRAASLRASFRLIHGGAA